MLDLWNLMVIYDEHDGGFDIIYMHLCRMELFMHCTGSGGLPAAAAQVCHC